MKNLDRVKIHFRENKKVYIATTIGIVVGAASVYFFTRNPNSESELLQKITQVGFRNEVNPTVINLIERSTASKPVHLVGTNLYFNSLNEAARETGHALSMLSKHVNGHIPDLNGDVFELLEPAA